MIDRREILEFSRETGLAADIVEKDYVLGWLLAGIYDNRDLKNTWIFKGGTCLKRCFFETRPVHSKHKTPPPTMVTNFYTRGIRRTVLLPNLLGVLRDAVQHISHSRRLALAQRAFLFRTGRESLGQTSATVLRCRALSSSITLPTGACLDCWYPCQARYVVEAFYGSS